MATNSLLLVVIIAEFSSFCETNNLIELDCSRTLRNETLCTRKTVQNNRIPALKPATVKKRQVGRVSRRQYEIIHLLQRKINIFSDVDLTALGCCNLDSTSKKNYIKQQYKYKEKIQEFPSMPTEIPLQQYNYQTTESFIEFYYMDDWDNLTTHGSTDQRVDKKGEEKIDSTVSYQAKVKKTALGMLDLLTYGVKTITSIRPEEKAILTNISDKIKFFESYDIHTPKSVFSLKLNNFVDNNNKDLRNQNHLEYLDVENLKKYNNNHIAKAVKKSAYVDDGNQTNIKIIKQETTTNIDVNNERYNYNGSFNFDSPTLGVISNVSKVAIWEDYSFVAVYVNKPYKVICEAASLSFHWLIASASCLSQHDRDPTADHQSAYVAYCGADWKHPERIAYVKSTVLHPMFNPKDNIKIHQFNIGAIQVASSMSSSCSGWSRISLMSYQYATHQEGSLALAVGWGLNRFGSKNDRSLSEFKGFVYSEYCPGNVRFSREKRLGNELVENLYCLALPPYLEEKTDPVHGSFLLVDGKLIALYLQEDRRPWGEQSAIYTGVWKLIPWLHEVMKEPEEIEFLSLD